MTYNGLNDFEVLYMIKENDEIAYNVMYDKYHSLISSLATSYCKNFKELDVEYDDLYQEGLCALNNAIKEFTESYNCLFYTYLMVCAKRQMEKYIKMKTRAKHKILTEAISIDKEVSSTNLKLEDVVSDGISLYDKLIDSLTYKKILDLKYELIGNQALVYELKLNNFSNKEIAILLDMSYRSIDNILRKIKIKLKKYVNENWESVL